MSRKLCALVLTLLVTQSGATVTAWHAGWNGALAPGASTAFGFLASWSGPGQPPTAAGTAT